MNNTPFSALEAGRLALDSMTNKELNHFADIVLDRYQNMVNKHRTAIKAAIKAATNDGLTVAVTANGWLSCTEIDSSTEDFYLSIG